MPASAVTALAVITLHISRKVSSCGAAPPAPVAFVSTLHQSHNVLYATEKPSPHVADALPLVGHQGFSGLSTVRAHAAEHAQPCSESPKPSLDDD
jgi:hypothetical protein